MVSFFFDTVSILETPWHDIIQFTKKAGILTKYNTFHFVVKKRKDISKEQRHSKSYSIRFHMFSAFIEPGGGSHSFTTWAVSFSHGIRASVQHQRVGMDIPSGKFGTEGISGRSRNLFSITPRLVICIAG